MRRGGSRAGPVLGLVVDHGVGVGAGHLSRGLALGQAWAAAGGLVVAREAADLPDGWRRRYEDAGISWSRQEDLDVDVHALDGYRLPPDLPARLGASGPVLVIDDHGIRGTYSADLIVDQNLGADPARYSTRPAGSRLLLGPRYALLRADVTAARPSTVPDRTGPVARVLVAAGGDPPPRVAELVRDVVAGLAGDGGPEVAVLRGTDDVGGALADADVVVSAAGSTVWEICVVGLPSVVVATVDNQRPVARAVGRAAAALDCGDLEDLSAAEVLAATRQLLLDPERRQALATRSYGLVDGQGSHRVATELRSTLVALRPAELHDAELLWGWVNDPAVREMAFSSEPIAWEAHLEWLRGGLAADHSRIWIASDHRSDLLGQVRVEVDADGVGLIDVSVAPDRRGQGWAAALLVALVHQAERSLGAAGLRVLEARIRPENRRSVGAFRAADFVLEPAGSREAQGWHTYTRRCDG